MIGGLRVAQINIDGGWAYVGWMKEDGDGEEEIWEWYMSDLFNFGSRYQGQHPLIGLFTSALPTLKPSHFLRSPITESVIPIHLGIEPKDIKKGGARV